MPSFSGPKWSMIYMKCFSIHHMPCFPMLSLSLPMTWLHLSYPIYIIWTFCFVCHASLSGPNDLLWWDFFYAHAFFPGTNMPHEWNDYMNEMTSISFFYGHAFFPGTNMLHEWNDFLYDMTISLSIVCLFPKYKHATWIMNIFLLYLPGSLTKEDVEFNQEKKLIK